MEFGEGRGCCKMMRVSHLRMIRKALAFSAALNFGLILTSLPVFPKPILKIADTIAAPPGLIVDWAVHPKQHTSGAFLAAAVESLTISVIFYAVAFWCLLMIFVYLRSASDDRGTTGLGLGR